MASGERSGHYPLEVLVIRKGPKWDGEPLGLARLAGLPNLRTLCADPETLADPLEITELATLEYLELARRTGEPCWPPRPYPTACWPPR